MGLDMDGFVISRSPVRSRRMLYSCVASFCGLRAWARPGRPSRRRVFQIRERQGPGRRVSGPRRGPMKRLPGGTRGTLHNLASPGARSLLSRGALWSVSRTPLGRILAHLHASPNQILQLNVLCGMRKGLQNLYAWVRLPPAPPFRINNLRTYVGSQRAMVLDFRPIFVFPDRLFSLAYICAGANRTLTTLTARGGRGASS